MKKQSPIHVGICELKPVQVIYKTCIFRHPKENYDKKIRQAFQALREWTIRFGLDPNQLSHIGIPTMNENSWSCTNVASNFPSQ